MIKKIVFPGLLVLMVLGGAGVGRAQSAETAPFPSLEIFGQILQEPNRVWEVMPPQPGLVVAILVKPNQRVSKDTPLARLRPKAGGPAFEVKSPGHGIVLTLYAKEKENVDTVTSLMTIAGEDVLKSSFDVYERDIRKITLGQPIRVTAMAFPGRTFKGKITFISPQIDAETRTVKVQSLIRNKAHKLRFGMMVTGELGPNDAPNHVPVKNKSASAVEPEAPADSSSKGIALQDTNGVIQTLRVARRTFKVTVKVLGDVSLEAHKTANKKQCRFDLYEADLSRVHEGQTLKIYATALGTKEFTGLITFLSPRIDENTRSVKLLTDVNDPAGELTPGMSLAGDIEISSRNVFAVPLTTVQTVDGEPAVFASQDGSHFFVHKVKLGERSGGMTEIISGLNEGEIAVSNGGLLLKQEYLNQTEDSQ